MKETGKIFLTEKMLIRVIELNLISIGEIYFILKSLLHKYELLYKKIGLELANLIIKEKTSSTSQD